MNIMIYNQLQLREVFHLEFLRWLNRKLKVDNYAVKNGGNLRFFFNNIRYSEDMDLDVRNVRVEILKEIVMKILYTPSFHQNLISYGIVNLVPPDIKKAKQTETTQRFKVHLITKSGEDLLTKVEFSRRGFKGKILVESVSTKILHTYKLPPLLVPHYDIQSTITQKLEAIMTRRIVQPRDIFDLYFLISQYGSENLGSIGTSRNKLKEAYNTILEVDFIQFRDSVLPYLQVEDQALYYSSDIWDEVKLTVANFIERLMR